MGAEHRAAGIDDRTRRIGERAVAGEEARLARARKEAQVLRLAAIGDRHAGFARELADLRLGELAERERSCQRHGRRARRAYWSAVLARSAPRAAGRPACGARRAPWRG
jgi:hypothetical protein